MPVRFLSVPPVAASSPYVFSDNFTRANNATTAGSTPTGNYTWTALAGTWGINGNRLYVVSNPSNAIVVVNPGVSDNFTYICTMATESSYVGGILFRGVDASNFITVFDNGGSYVLRLVIGGGSVDLGSSTVAPAAGDVIKVVVSGQSITVYVNGVQQITGTTSQFQTATLFGFLEGFGSTNVTYGERIPLDTVKEHIMSEHLNQFHATRFSDLTAAHMSRLGSMGFNEVESPDLLPFFRIVPGPDGQSLIDFTIVLRSHLTAAKLTELGAAGLNPYGGTDLLIFHRTITPPADEQTAEAPPADEQTAETPPADADAPAPAAKATA